MSKVLVNARTLRPIIKDDRLGTLYVGDGSSPIQLRLYDKWKEIAHSGKVFFLDVWGDKLQTGELPCVWRVEGQFRRAVLKEFGIDSLADLFAQLPGLWNYLTQWASLRLPDDANSTRRTLHPLWAAVQSAAALLGDPALVARRFQSDATAPVDWYVAHIAGCLVAFAARLNLAALTDALRMLQVFVHAHLPPPAFAARVQAELIRLGVAATPQQPT